MRIRRFIQATVPSLFVAFVVVIAWNFMAAKSTLPVPVLPNQLFSIEPSSKISFQAHSGETVRTHVMIRNVTKNPIILLGANSSCSCTVLLDEFPMEIKPWATRKLTVGMNIGLPDSTGKITRTIVLLTNHAGIVPPLTLEATILDASLTTH